MTFRSTGGPGQGLSEALMASLRALPYTSRAHSGPEGGEGGERGGGRGGEKRES